MFSLLTVVPGCLPGKKGGNPLDDVARLIGPRPAYVKTYLAETADHWRLGLHRYAPEKLDPTRMPVVLCHGLGYNGRFWDLDKKTNFAEFLRNAGWDTWVLDLRGGGSSSLPIWYLFRGLDLDLVKNLQVDLTKFGWTVDDYILHDVPTAVDFVCKETGAPAAAWIGHSMGGMIAMAHLERAQEPRLGCFVAVASPMIMPRPLTQFEKQAEDFQFAILAINNRWYATIRTLSLGALNTPVDDFFYNKANLDAVTTALLYLRVAEDVPAPVLDQFLKMTQTGHFLSADGQFDYSANLSRLQLPVLFIAGKVDAAADSESVRYAYDRVSSRDKTFRMFGLAWKDAVDYGHDDLILGVHAAREVYPVIGRWLETRARLTPSRQGPASPHAPKDAPDE